ncbi:MAG: vitamin K epoxide reductase family protein [Pseudomonadota bacterium]|nr:vitamin K epoxide reductase family protein [Pseudomonadota bacterium]
MPLTGAGNRFIGGAKGHPDMRFSPYIILFIVAAAAGLFFAGFSTHDFVEHLDRQVHSIHCSFIPGLDNPDASGASGCHVTMMSPYSSVFRGTLWGGLPVSLPAMSVFAFLLFRGVDLLVNRGSQERGPRIFLVAAAALPVLTSLVFGYLSLVELDAACKLCIGIYSSSLVCFIAALLELRAASQPGLGSEFGILGEDRASENGDLRDYGLSFGQGVGFVAIPALVYVIAMPDYAGYTGTCGALAKPEDPYNMMVALGPQGAGAEAIEVFDPLCPACKGFETRLESSGLEDQMSRRAVMFPLDNTCNWMVSSAVHPGACTVSEAVLCAEPGKADAVVDWAFENQTAIREAAKADPAAAGAMVLARFPEMKSCLGGAAVKSKLNKSLRWAVANQLAVLTPQLYVNGVKLCDEDTDLGMEYALSRLLENQAKGGSQ